MLSLLLAKTFDERKIRDVKKRFFVAFWLILQTTDRHDINTVFSTVGEAPDGG